MRPDEPSQANRQIVRREGRTLAFTDEGGGPAILAAHGLPGTVRDFRWLAPAVRGDLRIVRLDMPGFGQASADRDVSTTHKAASYLVLVMDHLEIDRAVLLSHSYGAMWATAAATRHRDRIAGLGLLAPVGFSPHRGLRRMPARRVIGVGLRTPLVGRLLLEVLKRGAASAGFPHATPAEIRRTILELNQTSWEKYEERVRQIEQPSLCAWATDDKLIENRLSSAVADALPDGPRLTFDSGGHNIQKTRAVELAEVLVPWASNILASSDQQP